MFEITAASPLRGRFENADAAHATLPRPVQPSSCAPGGNDVRIESEQGRRIESVLERHEPRVVAQGVLVDLLLRLVDEVVRVEARDVRLDARPILLEPSD